MLHIDKNSQSKTPFFFVLVALLLFLSNPLFSTASDDHQLSSLELRLESLLTLAQSKGVSLKVAHEDINQASAGKWTQTSRLFPQAELFYKKEEDLRNSPSSPLLNSLGLSSLSTPPDSTWGLKYHWALIDWQKWQNYQKAKFQYEKSINDSQKIELEFKQKFKEHFLLALLARYKIKTIENSIMKAETGKKEAELGFKLGVKTKIDTLRSEANLASLVAKKSLFSEEKENSLHELVEFSGLSADNFGFIEELNEEDIFNLIVHITKNAQSFIPKAQSQDQIYKTLEFYSLSNEEKIKNIEIETMVSAEYPTLYLQGTLAHTGSSFNQSIHNPSRTHSIALVLTIPFSTGGSYISSQFEKYAAARKIQYLIENKKLKLSNTISAQTKKIKSTQNLVSSLDLNVHQYEELYRLTLKSYQLGKNTLFDLLEMQDKLLDSKISLAENRIKTFIFVEDYLRTTSLR